MYIEWKDAKESHNGCFEVDWLRDNCYQTTMKLSERMLRNRPTSPVSSPLGNNLVSILHKQVIYKLHHDFGSLITRSIAWFYSSVTYYYLLGVHVRYV